jgi:tol-pal system protein YbgF
MMRRNRIGILLAIVAASSLSGCLKTRAQLRGDGADPAEPRLQEVRDVRPQGAYALDEMKQEITRLTGRIEDLERQQSQLQHQARAKDDSKAEAARAEELKRLETRIAELESTQLQTLEALKKLQSSAPPPDTADLMRSARAQLKAKQYDAAIETLAGVLKNPKSKDAEEATFLRAEAYFESKQYKKAIIDYSKFPEKFSKSKHMPAALLRIGQSFEALGMKEDAKGFFTEVSDKYPKSAEAKKAKARPK